MLAASMRCVAPLAAPAKGCTGSADSRRGVGADMTTRMSAGWLASPGTVSRSDGSELLLRVSDRSGGGCPHAGVQSEPAGKHLFEDLTFWAMLHTAGWRTERGMPWTVHRGPRTSQYSFFRAQVQVETSALRAWRLLS